MYEGDRGPLYYVRIEQLLPWRLLDLFINFLFNFIIFSMYFILQTIYILQIWI